MSFQTNVSHRFKKIVWNIFFVFLSLIILSLLSSIAYTIREMNRNAQSFAESARNELLIGNYRQARVQLSSAFSMGFLRVQYRDFSGHQSLVMTPSQVQESKYLYRYAYALQNVSNKDSSGRAEIVFYYSPFANVKPVLFFWLIFMLVNIPLWLYGGKRLKLYYAQLAKDKIFIQMGQISRQVAHDIRSPLGSLKMISMKVLWKKPGDQEIFESALSSIEKISEDILEMAQNASADSTLKSQEPPNQQKTLSNVMKSSADFYNEEPLVTGGPVSKKNHPFNPIIVLRSVLPMKAVEFGCKIERPNELSRDEGQKQGNHLGPEYGDKLVKEHDDVARRGSQNLRWEVTEDLLGQEKSFFAMGDASQFERIISNIINNAKEAIIFKKRPEDLKESDVGVIFVHSSLDEDGYTLEIRDTGRGIPSNILQKLGQEEISFDKEKGNGVGLLFAKQTIESWSGELSIYSQEGRGTTVRIFLPKATE